MYKRPESVLVLVCSRGGEVLMLRRREPADFWQSVTGSLRWSETPIEAARRELAEETGLSGEGLEDCERSNRFPIVPPWRQRYAPEAHENLEHLFRLVVPRAIPVTLNPAEHLEYRWLDREAASGLASSWTNRDAILEFVSENVCVS